MIGKTNGIATGAGKLIQKEVVLNGTYDAAQDNADGYSIVQVDVPNPLRQACLGEGFVFIPATIGNDVTEVPAYLFYKNAQLREAILPHDVDTIGAYGFYSCSSLASITIDCPNLTTIGNTAFSNNTAMRTLYFRAPLLTTAPDTLFNNCYALETAELYIPKLFTKMFTVSRRLRDVTIGEMCSELQKQIFHLNISEHSTCSILYIVFLRHKIVEDGVVIQDVPTLAGDSIGDRATSKLFLYVPIESLLAYKNRFNGTSSNRRYINCIRPFQDCEVGDVLPSTLEQTDSEVTESYTIVWYEDKEQTTPVQSTTVSTAGRYWGIATVV